MKIIPPSLLLIGYIILPSSIADPGVHILAENLAQVLTSSTLKWATTNTRTTNYENAVVGAYQIIDNSTSNPTKHPVYVCRARLNGLWVAGHLRPSDLKCIVTLHGLVHETDSYEVLINIEDSANLSWVYRDKYTLDPQGAVAGGDEPLRNFIARRKLEDNVKKDNILTHVLGKLDPKPNFGKYTFVDQHNKQVEYEDGEILVETEPTRYEMMDIKYDNIVKAQPREERVLGQVVLKNEESDETAKVDTVISYNYTYKLNWGHGHGLLIGLPFEVYEKGKSYNKGQWGIVENNQKVEVSTIEYFLAPGTAVNVTLRGYYVESDWPYTATVVSYYPEKGKDGIDREVKRERLIKDSKRESTMIDVNPEFGQVYFLHNNSYVPTTTTTTSTTTTSTTTRKTTTATEALPIIPPDVEKPIKGKKKVEDVESAKKHENNSMMSDDGDALSLKKKDSESDQKSIGNVSFPNSFRILLVVLVMLRVT